MILLTLLYWLFLALLFLLLITLIGFIIYGRRNYGAFEKEGIPVANRSFFLGSNSDLHLKVQHLEDIERFKKYGPVFGVYEGSEPHIYICDPELVRQITVKDYHEYFYNRRVLDFGLNDPFTKEILDFQQDEKWKIMRSWWTPYFTIGKVKKMGSKMEEAAKGLIAHLNNEIGDKERLKLAPKKAFEAYIIDAISRSVYGINLEKPYDPNNYLTKALSNFMLGGFEANFIFTLFSSFPFLTKIFFHQQFNTEDWNKFGEVFFKILEDRKQLSKRGDTYDDILDNYVKIMNKIGDSEEFKRVGINKYSVIAQITGIVIAGFDGMGTAATLLLYELSKEENSEKLEKIYKEIDKFWEKHGAGGDIDHEKLKELVYLNACITETLRLYPPVIRIERKCGKDWERNGVTIKKDWIVQMPLWPIQRNSEYFSNPNSFEPERFLENEETLINFNKTDFLTFGSGSKNCLGMKYAYDILLYGLAYLLKDFKFEKREDTVFKDKTGSSFILIFEPLYLDLIKR